MCSAFYRKTFLGKCEKSPNEEWRINVPSSIGVRPMGQKGTNAYAEMGRICAVDGAQLGPGNAASCSLIIDPMTWV